MSLTEPSKQEALDLLKSIEQHFPSKTLGTDKWFILAIAAISAGGHPEFSADLYLHLITRPEYSTPSERQALVRRLRETLIKLVSVVGVPKPLEAIFAIGAVERDEDKDYSFSREHWQSGEANLKRGMDWLDQIYKANHNATEDALAAHKDFCTHDLSI